MSGILNLDDITLPAGPAYKNISEFLRVSLSVTSGLVGLYQFGGSLAASLENIANPAAPLTAVGAPTISTIGATLDKTACFDTGFADTADLTFIAVAKPLNAAAAAQNIMIGNYADAAPSGALLYQNAATTAALRVTNGTGSAQTGAGSDATITPDYTKYNIFSGRAEVAGAGAMKVGWSHDGVLTAGTQVTLTGRTPVARNLRIGGSYSTGFPGSRQFLGAAIWNRSISDAELATVVAELRTFYTALGITTL